MNTRETILIRIGLALAVIYVIVFIVVFIKIIQEDFNRRDIAISNPSQRYTLVSSSTEFHVIDNQTKDTIYTERMNYPNSSKLQEALTKNQE